MSLHNFDSINVRCPTCDALPGKPCFNLNKNKVLTKYHAARNRQHTLEIDKIYLTCKRCQEEYLSFQEEHDCIKSLLQRVLKLEAALADAQYELRQIDRRDFPTIYNQ